MSLFVIVSLFSANLQELCYGYHSDAGFLHSTCAVVLYSTYSIPFSASL